MIYGVVIVVAFIYITVRVHMRLKERGEEGLPIVGDLLNVLCGIGNTSKEMISVGTKFYSKENMSEMPNAPLSANSAEASLPQARRRQRNLQNSTEMDSSSSDTAGEQETTSTGKNTDPLRERGEEGLPIVGEFVDKFIERYRKRSRDVIVLDGISDSSDNDEELTSATQNSTKADKSPLIQLPPTTNNSAEMDSSSSESIRNASQEEEIKKFTKETSAIRGN